MLTVWGFVLLVSSVAANPLLAERQYCNADYCLRALRGNTPGTSSASADCSAFVKTTVPAATSTVTQYVTAALKPRHQFDARADKVIPTYATNGCGNQVSRYTSACSCLGVTPGTVSSGTTVVTATITATPSKVTAGSCTRGR